MTTSARQKAIIIIILIIIIKFITVMILHWMPCKLSSADGYKRREMELLTEPSSIKKSIAVGNKIEFAANDALLKSINIRLFPVVNEIPYRFSLVLAR